MLILLLSVSAVFCSPAQLPTFSNNGKYGEEFPSSSTSSLPVDVTTVTFPSKGQRKNAMTVRASSNEDHPKVPLTTQREKRIIAVGDHSLKNSNQFTERLPNKPTVPIQSGKDGHITSEVRTVAFQISEQDSPKFIFSPIRSFQPASESYHKSTVEMNPGNTFSTGDMPILLTPTERTTKKSQISEPPARFNVRYIQRYTSNKSNNSDRRIFKPIPSIVEHLSYEATTHNSHVQDQTASPTVGTTNISNGTKFVSISLPKDSQTEDNSNTESKNYEENISPTRNEFKIKTRNNTYALVHNAEYQKLASFNKPNNATAISKNVTENQQDKNTNIKSKTEHLTNYTLPSATLQPQEISVGEGKVPVTEEVVPYTTFDTLSFTGDLEFEPKNSNLQTNSFSPDQVETTTFAGYGSENDDDTLRNYKQSSIIQTREVDNESFFRSVDAPIGTRVVKKDELDATKWQAEHSNENPYEMDSITSSSELSYKQFNFLGNVSQYQSTPEDSKVRNVSRNVKSDSEESDINFSQREYPFIISDKETDAGDERSSAHGGKDKNDKIALEQINVTSLPSHTSVVEPLKTNSSSSMAEVTLPSAHHRTKSDQNANSHSVSSSINVKIAGPYAVGVYPEKVSGMAVSEASSVLQERVSIQLPAHVNQRISSGSVAAIVIGVLLSMALVGGAAAYIVYQRLEGFRPKILSSDRSCANSDSGGYLDDQCRVAYVNSQLDIPKSTPEDLVSLDNDSFLNSLESMTIQNLWTDSIRHTKL